MSRRSTKSSFGAGQIPRPSRERRSKRSGRWFRLSDSENVLTRSNRWRACWRAEKFPAIRRIWTNSQGWGHMSHTPFRSSRTGGICRWSIGSSPEFSVVCSGSLESSDPPRIGICGTSPEGWRHEGRPHGCGPGPLIWRLQSVGPVLGAPNAQPFPSAPMPGTEK